MTELREMFEMTTKQIDPDLNAWEDQEHRQRKRSARRKAGALALAATLAIVTIAIAVQVVRNTGGTTPRPANRSHATAMKLPIVAHAYVEPFPTALVVSGGEVYARLSSKRGPAYTVGFHARSTATDALTPFCGGGIGGPDGAISGDSSATRCGPVTGFSGSHTQRVVTGDRVVVASEHQGSVRAFASDCADPSHCQPLWSISVSSSTFVVGHHLVLSAGGGLVFAFPQDQVGLYAFPLNCGTGNVTCEPTWSWGTGEEGRFGRVQAAVVAENRLYVAVTELSHGGTIDRRGSQLYVFQLGGTA
jgi:hypothetical protein